MRKLAALALCLAISGCGGGGGGNGSVPSSRGSTAVPLSITIPSKTASASSTKTRKPAFVSVLTQSITVNAYAQGAQAPSTPNTVANVGVGQTGCTGTTASGVTCVIDATAPVGNDTLVISAYSGTSGSGSLLSQATVNVTVKAGMAALVVTMNSVGASISGDMLGYAPSRTWTYTANGGYGTFFLGYSYYGYAGGGSPFVAGMYADPSTTNGVETYVAFVAAQGSSNPFTQGMDAGNMGVQPTSNGNEVYSFGSVSNNTFGLVPGTPLLVPSSLQLGTSWNPVAGLPQAFTGGTTGIATVIAVGSVPGMSACPNNPPGGATVQYTFSNIPNTALSTQTETVSYVPGCGISDIVTETGVEITLTNVGTQSLGQLSISHNPAQTLMQMLRNLWQRLLVPH